MVFTIGYAGYHQDVARFVSDLKAHRVTVVADVRTSPYSRYAPEFNRDTLQYALRQAELKYVFMGQELGARPSDRSCYTNGRVDYEKIMAAPFFGHGLDRIQDGLSKGYVIALLCAEKDPICCHRAILVGRALARRGIPVRHLWPHNPGEPAVAESSEDAESRLFEECDQGDNRQGDLFMSYEERLETVYRMRFQKIAFKEENENDNNV